MVHETEAHGSGADPHLVDRILRHGYPDQGLRLTDHIAQQIAPMVVAALEVAALREHEHTVGQRWDR